MGWSTYTHDLDRLPDPDPSEVRVEVRVEVPDRPRFDALIGMGARVQTSYGTGPYEVDTVTAYQWRGFTLWSLTMFGVRKTGERTRNAPFIINDPVVEWEGDEPHFRTLFRDNDGEVFLVDGLDSLPEQELIVAPDGGDVAARGAGPGDDDNRGEPVERHRPVRGDIRMTDEPLRLTYRELGGRLGISPDAARMKAKREAGKAGSGWRLIPGNHPSDPVHVELPADALPERAPLRPLVAPDADEQIPMFPERAPPADFNTRDFPASWEKWLRSPLEMLALERERGAATETALRDEIAAHGETKAALAAARVELDQARDANADMMEELGIANDYVEKAARALQDSERSWWRRIWG